MRIFRKPFCRCSRFMIFGSTFLKFTYYLIFSESACVFADLINIVYAVCPYVFNRTLSYSILYSVVVFVFLPSILQTLFFLLPFQRAIEWRAAMLLRASQSHNPVYLWCSFSFSTLFPDIIFSFSAIIQLWSKEGHTRIAFLAAIWYNTEKCCGEIYGHSEKDCRGRKHYNRI